MSVAFELCLCCCCAKRYHCRKCDTDVCMVCALNCHAFCCDSKSGCTSAIELRHDLSKKPTYCDCNKRNCRSLVRGVYPGAHQFSHQHGAMLGAVRNDLIHGLAPPGKTFHQKQKQPFEPPMLEDTAASVGDRKDLFGPNGSLLSVATAVAQNSHRSWVRSKKWCLSLADCVLYSWV